MKRRLLTLARDGRGVAAVEFALVVPVLSFMMVGVLSFGLALNNYVDLTEGVRVAARVLAQASAYPSQAYDTAFCNTSGSSTCSGGGYFGGATAYLNSSSLNWSVYVYTPGDFSTATACNSTTSSVTSADNTACNSDLTTSGKAVTVTATYSQCITVFGHNFLPNCRLSVSTTQMVE